MVRVPHEVLPQESTCLRCWIPPETDLETSEQLILEEALVGQGGGEGKEANSLFQNRSQPAAMGS